MAHIGELSRRVGVNAKTIRYYEELGLLSEPQRSPRGYRLYGDVDERRLRFIATARNAGFRLGEIKEILALRDRGETPCSYVAERIEIHRQDIDRQLRDLRRLRSELDDLRRRARTLSTTPPATRDYCHILERP